MLTGTALYDGGVDPIRPLDTMSYEFVEVSEDFIGISSTVKTSTYQRRGRIMVSVLPFDSHLVKACHRPILFFLPFIYVHVSSIASVNSALSPPPPLSQHTADSKNAKKKNNKKTNKNKSSVSRANKKKPGMPNVANDLSQKLYSTLEKHKEVDVTHSTHSYNTAVDNLLL